MQKKVIFFDAQAFTKPATLSLPGEEMMPLMTLTFHKWYQWTLQGRQDICYTFP